MSPGSPPPAVLKKVTVVVAAELEVKAADISPASRLVDDLGMDSLAAAEIVARLENEFDIEFGLEAMSDLARVQTAGDLAVVVSACLGESGPTST